MSQPGWGKVEGDGACPHPPWAKLPAGWWMWHLCQTRWWPSAFTEHWLTVFGSTLNILDCPPLKSTKTKDKEGFKKLPIIHRTDKTAGVCADQTHSGGRVLGVNEAEARFSQEANPDDVEHWCDAVQVETEQRTAAPCPYWDPLGDPYVSLISSRALICVDGNKRDYTEWTRRPFFQRQGEKQSPPEQS